LTISPYGRNLTASSAALLTFNPPPGGHLPAIVCSLHPAGQA
jgi:hypothetical protein